MGTGMGKMIKHLSVAFIVFFCRLGFTAECGDVNGRVLFSIDSWEESPPEIEQPYRVVAGTVLVFSASGDVVMINGVFHVELGSAQISFCYNCGYSVWRAQVPEGTSSCLVSLVFEDVKARMTADGNLARRRKELDCDISGSALVSCGPRVFLSTQIENVGDLFNLIHPPDE